MSTHKWIDRVCAAAMLLTLLLTVLFVNGEALGIRPASGAAGYASRLFNTERVHTIEIVMDDWNGFLETCEDEEYAACSVVIDNEAYKNVGLRAKGNTSLSMVSSLGSNRYSFKIEFDQYDSGKSYYGLDKLCLNNIIQDNTYMKDYLTYRMMAANGVDAPLCSFVYITVNGEDWGLYLAVEGVEDGFLRRNFGAQHGSLYKPDSMSFGGGRGNGRDFDMGELMNAGGNIGSAARGSPAPWEQPESFDSAAMPGGWPENGRAPGAENGGPPSMPGGGMGAADVKLQYIDDDPDSYANIFSSAKTDVTDGDQARLIRALKTLSEGERISEAVDIDKTLRYFVVHNYVVNGDSYTGSMVHNYYLYEENGRLSMIPWDYNLAFGTFQAEDATGAVNDPIDSPLSVSGSGDRPMADWIFADETYTQLYHQYFTDFLETVDPIAMLNEAYELIAPYVERDPTKFCTYAEFEAGAEALRSFCRLRTQSVSGQLAGTIPSTSSGQSENGAALADASGLSLSDMGTMNRGGGFPGGRRERTGEFGGAVAAPDASTAEAPPANAGAPSQNASEIPGKPLEAGTDAPPEAGGGTPLGDLDRAATATPFSGGLPGGPERSPVPAEENRAPSRQGLLLLGLSALALPVGIATACRYKRRGRHGCACTKTTAERR